MVDRKLCDLADSDQRLINAIREDWERQLDLSEEADISQFLTRVSSARARDVLLTELLMCEIDFALRHAARSDTDCRNQGDNSKSVTIAASPSIRWLKQARERHRELSSKQLVDLIAYVYCLEQHYGTRPKVSEFQEQFESLKGLSAAIRQSMHDEWPTFLRLKRPDVPFRQPLDVQLTLGRQSRDDPSPFGRVVTSDGTVRLVVAPKEERRAARQHVRLEIISRDHVLITNASRKSELLVHRSDLIAPGKRTIQAVPFDFRIVDMVFCVERC